MDVTNADVTHGLMIEEFGINVVIPAGITNTIEFTADKTGNFDISCSVYCGPGHSKMQGTLKVIEWKAC